MTKFQVLVQCHVLLCIAITQINIILTKSPMFGSVSPKQCMFFCDVLQDIFAFMSAAYKENPPEELASKKTRGYSYFSCSVRVLITMFWRYGNTHATPRMQIPASLCLHKDGNRENRTRCSHVNWARTTPDH